MLYRAGTLLTVAAGIDVDEPDSAAMLQMVKINKKRHEANVTTSVSAECEAAMLSAYWEYGDCGFFKNDYNHKLCGGLWLPEHRNSAQGECPQTWANGGNPLNFPAKKKIEEKCPDWKEFKCLKATLKELQKSPAFEASKIDHNYANAIPINGCHYLWHAQYECVEYDTPVTTTTPPPTTTTTTTTTLPLVCQLHSNKKSWHDASDSCIAHGGTLASPTKASENAAVRSLAGGERVWIGFHDVSDEGNFVSSSGDAVTYTNWQGGEPNDWGSGEDCTEMYRSGTWNDLKCEGHTRPYICCARGDGLTGPTTTTTTQPLSCQLHDHQKSWHDAQASCIAHGGALASPTNEDENEDVRNVASGARVWIGFHDTSQEGSFEWGSGDPVSYTNWQSGEPNNVGASGEDCTEMYSSGTWNDLPCEGHPRAYVCCARGDGLISPTTTTTTTTTEELTCVFIDEKRSWHAAQNDCKARGSTLASPLSAEENAAVLATTGGARAWIGLHDLSQEGKFEWDSNDDLEYTNWQSGEPNDWRQKEDCTEMYKSGTWNDLPCEGHPRPYVCCARGGEPVLEATFTFHAEKVTYQQAQEACESDGGFLATINNAEENAEVYALTGGARSWIGFDDRVAEGQFEWVSGHSTVYTNWHRNEPNNVGRGGEDCTEMWGGGTWNDLPCSGHPRSFVCVNY